MDEEGYPSNQIIIKSKLCLMGLKRITLILLMKIYKFLRAKNFLFLAVGVYSHVMGEINIPREPFLFVRHGRTNWSKEDITLGPLDLPLSSSGIKDAKKAASILETLKNEEAVIISSELMRAQQTAAIIAKKLHLPVSIFPNLHERYFGDFRLLHESSLEGALPPGAESEEDFQKRINNSFSEALKAKGFAKKHKIIVAHCLIFKHLSFHLVGKKMPINYGEIFLFTPNDDGKTWSLHKIESNEVGYRIIL